MKYKFIKPRIGAIILTVVMLSGNVTTFASDTSVAETAIMDLAEDPEIVEEIIPEVKPESEPEIPEPETQEPEESQPEVVDADTSESEVSDESTSHIDDSPTDSSKSEKPSSGNKENSEKDSTESVPTDSSVTSDKPDESTKMEVTPTQQPKQENTTTTNQTNQITMSGTTVSQAPYRAGAYDSSLYRSLRVISSETRRKMVAFAMNYITEKSGVPYVWGGESLETGVDCSGFVQQVYRHFGMELPRTSSEQAMEGTRIDIADAKPGDLVFKARDGVVYHVMMVVENRPAEQSMTVVEARGAAWGIVVGEFSYDAIYCACRFADDDDFTSTQAKDLIKTGTLAAKGDKDARDEIIEKLSAACAREWSTFGFTPSVMIAQIIQDTNWMSFTDTDSLSAEDNRIIEFDSKKTETPKQKTEKKTEKVEQQDSVEATIADKAFSYSQSFGKEPDTKLADELFAKSSTALTDEAVKEKTVADTLFEHSKTTVKTAEKKEEKKPAIADTLSDYSMNAGEKTLADKLYQKAVKKTEIKAKPAQAKTTATKVVDVTVYEDIESCMEAYAESFIGRNEKLRNSTQYKDVVNVLPGRDDAYKKNILALIEEYKLDEYDSIDLMGIGRKDLSNYNTSELELLWAIVAQEDDTSYEGALAVITSAMNRADVNYGGYGNSAIEQLTAPGQYCYSEAVSPSYLYERRLGGNVPEFVKKAVEDCLQKGTRNHNFKNFRSTSAAGRTQIGSNWFF